MSGRDGSCLTNWLGLPPHPVAGMKLDKEMTMIAALKQHYEHYHAGDLTALKKLYEYHAENCVKAAELTEDTQQREEYLKLAREWTEAARSALDMNALDAKYWRNTRATDISDEMRAAVVEARGRSLRTSWSPRLSPPAHNGTAGSTPRSMWRED